MATFLAGLALLLLSGILSSFLGTLSKSCAKALPGAENGQAKLKVVDDTRAGRSLFCRSALFERSHGPIAVIGLLGGCVLCAIPTLKVLSSSQALMLNLPWSVPLGSLALTLDPLAAYFVLPFLILAAAAAVYGLEYVEPEQAARSWIFFHVLIASMLLVLTASNGLLFLLAWEAMALSSFFLVMQEDQQSAVRRAGWTYLVASQAGTLCLLALFALLGTRFGSLDFSAWRGFATQAPGLASAAFILALFGFGTKAGFVPLHVWLPEAHPAAPSHVSAVMSGVMIKTGIYGILRLLLLAGTVQNWWGPTLIVIGVSSGILGVLFALAQHDLKRLLAYHSVENIGIITLGLGLGLLGISHHSPILVLLSFSGGLLHVLNHALFKGLLFLGAGAVAKKTGTRDIDILGGLSKRMPTTAALFLLGSVAICGLPPLNGFVSEFLIYLGGFRGLLLGSETAEVCALLVLAGLALIGGLACACFTKAFGVVFLGEPRSAVTQKASEVGLAMRLGMLALGACCVALGLIAPLGFMLALGPTQQIAQSLGMALDLPALEADSFSILNIISIFACAVCLLAALLAGLRWLLLHNRQVTQAGTWDCGYAAPETSMQYTASSFAQPLIDLFGSFIWIKKQVQAPDGLYPQQGSFESHPEDTFRELLFAPAFRGSRWALIRMRWLQHGHLNLYVLYIALTALVLLLVVL